METLVRNGLNLYRTLNRYFRSRLVLLYFVVILLSLSFASFKFEFGNASKNSEGLLEVFVTVLWHEPNISSYKILCNNFRLNRLFNYWFLFNPFHATGLLLRPLKRGFLMFLGGVESGQWHGLMKPVVMLGRRREIVSVIACFC